MMPSLAHWLNRFWPHSVVNLSNWKENGEKHQSKNSTNPQGCTKAKQIGNFVYSPNWLFLQCLNDRTVSAIMCCKDKIINMSAKTWNRFCHQKSLKNLLALHWTARSNCGKVENEHSRRIFALYLSDTIWWNSVSSQMSYWYHTD